MGHHEPSAEIEIRVTPRSSRNRVTPTAVPPVPVYVTMPPAEGMANQAAIKLLADMLDVAPSRIEIVSGHHHRVKRVRVTGRSQAEVEALLLVSFPPC
ncbi:MAG: DUF167 domain-containing protein [Fimbriimonadaceae bacterium]